VTIFVIGHTIRDICAVSDRVVVLHRGHDKVADRPTAKTTSEAIAQYTMAVQDDSAAHAEAWNRSKMGGLALAPDTEIAVQ
jgi:ABC-type sugar transport system ATPase subunit